MAHFKAPGPEGLHASFYQMEWSIVGNSVIKQAKEFFLTGTMPCNLNDMLVPKVHNPKRENQFRPISLCNVSYKVITKAMTNRIKEIMRGLIGQEHSSFVPDRQITYNIIVYQEVMHSMQTTKGRKNIMVIKIDLEKAHDRLSWDFIKDTLQETLWYASLLLEWKSYGMESSWSGSHLVGA